MPGPWEKYQQQAAPAADTVIAVDPYKQTSEAREQERLRLEQERFRITQENAARMAEKDARASDPQHIVSTEALKAQGRAQGGVMASLPVLEEKAGQAIHRIDGLLSNKEALGSLTGFPSLSGIGQGGFGAAGQIWGTPAADTAADLKGLAGAIRTQAFESLKGGGHITEIESQFAAEAMANLERTRSKEGMAFELERLRKVLVNGLIRAKQQAGQLPEGPASQYGGFDFGRPEGTAAPGSSDTGGPDARVIDRMVRSGASLEAINAYLGAAGGSPTTQERYDQVRTFLQENPDHEGLLAVVRPPEAREEPQPPATPDDGIKATIGDRLSAGLGDIVEGGINNTVGLLANPVNTVLGRAAGYDDYTSNIGQTARDMLGFPEGDPTISAINQAATGALGLSGLARGASGLVSGAGRNALAMFGRTPSRDMVAGAGAGAGGELGEYIGGTPGRVVGTLAGGLAGYGGANALARTGGPRGPTPMAEAAQRQGVDMLPADAGGSVAKAVTTGTRASPFSVAPVAAAARRSQEQMGSAARRTAEGQGDIATTDIAGANVRAAAERYTKQTAQRGGQLYDRAGKLARGVNIKPAQTIAKLDEHIARLSENPAANAGQIESLKAFRGNIANGVKVQGLRDARTMLSQGVYNGQLRSGSEQAMWKDILGNLSDDIDRGLRSVGRDGAANMFKRADAFWKGRVEHIDEVLQPLLGRDKSGEQIVESIEAMARGKQGGGARLSRLLSNMSKEEAGSVRASIVDRMGRATPGAQSAEGTTFSAATYLTNWNKMTPQAKASLFSDKNLRRDLDDLATLAEGMKASQAMANTSNTGIAVMGNIAAQVALWLSHPVAMTLGIGAQLATGRLMASPGFARALARTSKMSPEAAGRKLPEQLRVLATREPALSSEINMFLQRWNAGSPASRAAADDERDEVRREPIGR